MALMLSILFNIVLPVLAMVGLGALLQRYRPLDIATLSHITIWLLVPTFLFVKVYQSDLTWHAIGLVVVGVTLPMLLVGGGTYVVSRHVIGAGSATAAIVFGSVIYNAGNFGIPVAELMYERGGITFPGMTKPTDGVAVQALIVMISNLSIWCVGYAVLAFAQGRGMRGMLGILRLPMIYTVILAFLFRDLKLTIPDMVWVPIYEIHKATVPVMLLALGAQLAQRARWPDWRRLAAVMPIKMLLLPIVTGIIVYMLGLWPWPGAQIIIASAAPVAVNTLILTLELDGDAEFAADCVFWSTLLSAVTVTAVILVVVLLGAPPPIPV